MYSKELARLIDLLLEKDPKNRPSVREILRMELIRKKAQEFVES
jgi:serine/threonine protein kinase